MQVCMHVGPQQIHVHSVHFPIAQVCMWALRRIHVSHHLNYTGRFNISISGIKYFPDIFLFFYKVC